jgi:hypothetical protein
VRVCVTLSESWTILFQTFDLPTTLPRPPWTRKLAGNGLVKHARSGKIPLRRDDLTSPPPLTHPTISSELGHSDSCRSDVGRRLIFSSYTVRSTTHSDPGHDAKTLVYRDTGRIGQSPACPAGERTWAGNEIGSSTTVARTMSDNTLL